MDLDITSQGVYVKLRNKVKTQSFERQAVSWGITGGLAVASGGTSLLVSLPVRGIRYMVRTSKVDDLEEFLRSQMRKHGASGINFDRRAGFPNLPAKVAARFGGNIYDEEGGASRMSKMNKCPNCKQEKVYLWGTSSVQKTYACDNCGHVVQVLRADLVMKVSAVGAAGAAGATAIGLIMRRPRPGDPQIPDSVDIPDHIWNADPGSLDGYSQLADYFDSIHEHIFAAVTDNADSIVDSFSWLGDAVGSIADVLG
jgi:Zn ribbon nucleic-acid-binding protein